MVLIEPERTCARLQTQLSNKTDYFLSLPMRSCSLTPFRSPKTTAPSGSSHGQRMASSSSGPSQAASRKFRRCTKTRWPRGSRCTNQLLLFLFLILLKLLLLLLLLLLPPPLLLLLLLLLPLHLLLRLFLIFLKLLLLLLLVLLLFLRLLPLLLLLFLPLLFLIILRLLLLWLLILLVLLLMLLLILKMPLILLLLRMLLAPCSLTPHHALHAAGHGCRTARSIAGSQRPRDLHRPHDVQRPRLLRRH